MTFDKRKYSREYYQENKKKIYVTKKKYYVVFQEKFKLRIGNKLRVEELECMNSNCNFNYEVWKKKNINRPYINCLTYEHIHSFFIVSKTFDKEAMNNHPIYMSKRMVDIIRTIKNLPDEYIREYLALSCEQCQADNIYQDRLDIYQDKLDLEEKKQ
tara:strand:+ start:921 stop:1391 length:471 start_codon:yes stop_codon:yes gene_type:complete